MKSIKIDGKEYTDNISLNAMQADLEQRRSARMEERIHSAQVVASFLCYATPLVVVAFFIAWQIIF